MTIRDHLMFQYRLMAGAVVTILALSSLLLHASTPVSHTFLVAAIAIGEIAICLLFWARFKCSNCNGNLAAVSRQILFRSSIENCPHCGVNLDQSS